jgi:SWI/SNF-related matrix-associated actin-dependent regulator of chromatin subfamily B protein 1
MVAAFQVDGKMAAVADSSDSMPSKPIQTTLPSSDAKDHTTNAAAGATHHDTSDVRDAIQEGKEKAKAVMTASGVDVVANATLNGDSQPEAPSPSRERLTNGKPPSRKRSRSGPRKPAVAPVNEKGERLIETDMDKYRLLHTIERDNDYASLLLDQLSWHRDLLESKKAELNYYDQLRRLREHNPGAVFGPGFQGFGNGHTDVPNPTGRLPFLYPFQKKRAGNRRARRFFISRSDMDRQADLAEELVAIRLDVEHDKIKLRDTFTWNLHDRVIPPEVFAETLVEDFKVPPEHAGFVAQQVMRKLMEQTHNHYPHVYIQDKPLDEHLPYFAYKNDEMRILIKLNITIGPHTLVDQFEWEINNPMNNPEEFARLMTRDLSLSGEFTTAIAHQIREQGQMFTKALYITSHPFDGRPVEDADVRDSFLPSPLPSVFRPAQSAKDYTPYLYELSEADLQREEVSILREQRRQKRSVTRRGGPALPDLKDRERTVRSLVISSTLPGAAESLETARVFKLMRTSGRRRTGGRTDGGDDSEESESEESEMEEVVPQVISTSRGRVVRGAATAAQAAMRANFGRSATPEIAVLHHHETRTSARRGGYEAPEESISEPSSLLVKLRLPKEIFRQWVQNPSKFRLDRPRSTSSRSNTPQRVGTPGRTAMKPPPSPASQSRHRSTSASKQGAPDSWSAGANDAWVYQEDGRILDAPSAQEFSLRVCISPPQACKLLI